MLQLLLEITYLVSSSILNLLIFVVKREPLWAHVGPAGESAHKAKEESNSHNGKVLIGVARLKDKPEYQILRVPELFLKNSRLEPSSANFRSNSNCSHNSRTATSIGNRLCENEEEKHNINVESSTTAALISSQKIDDGSCNTTRTTLETKIANVKMTLSSRGGASLRQHENLNYTSFRTYSSTMKYKRLPPSPLLVSASSTKPRPRQDLVTPSIDFIAITNDQKKKSPNSKLRLKAYEARSNHSLLDRHGHCARCFKE